MLCMYVYTKYIHYDMYICTYIIFIIYSISHIHYIIYYVYYIFCIYIVYVSCICVCIYIYIIFCSIIYCSFLSLRSIPPESFGSSQIFTFLCLSWLQVFAVCKAKCKEMKLVEFEIPQRTLAVIQQFVTEEFSQYFQAFWMVSFFAWFCAGLH